MHKLFRLGLLITYGLFLVCIISGCTDNSLSGNGDEPVRVNLVATTPKDGGTISVNGELRMAFDGPLGGVTVDGMRATIMSDSIASMQIADLGAVTPGATKRVIISWINLDYSYVGTQTLSFTLTPAPATEVEVDPVPGSGILTNTQFTLRFDQEVVAV